MLDHKSANSWDVTSTEGSAVAIMIERQRSNGELIGSKDLNKRRTDHVAKTVNVSALSGSSSPD